MGLTTILSIFILQLTLSDKLPKTSDVIPLICKKSLRFVGRNTFIFSCFLLHDGHVSFNGNRRHFVSDRCREARHLRQAGAFVSAICKWFRLEKT